MLKDRILLTLRFFDLQNFPLTLLELQKYLLPETEELKNSLDEKYELKIHPAKTPAIVSAGEILTCLEKDLWSEVETGEGFYCLKGRKSIIQARLENYTFGLRREKLLRKFIPFLRHLPFVRAVALLGSQALGMPKEKSDIDLFIITDERSMWLARMLVTAYFQILGLRRHGRYIANRFCLNHYLAGVRELESDRNLYTATEYLKMRPLIYEENLVQFQQKNLPWLAIFFPNFSPVESAEDKFSSLQPFFERLLSGLAGGWLERICKNFQMQRIKQGEFIVATEKELSFHPNNRKRQLFQKFFQNQSQVK